MPNSGILKWINKYLKTPICFLFSQKIRSQRSADASRLAYADFPPAMDVDLLGMVENSIENLEKIVRECCTVEADDGVIFRPETVVGSVIRKNA